METVRNVYRITSILAILAVALIPAGAKAQTLGPASDYSDFIFGKGTQSVANIESLAGIGGNATFASPTATLANVAEAPINVANLAYNGNIGAVGTNISPLSEQVNGAIVAASMYGSLEPGKHFNVSPDVLRAVPEAGTSLLMLATMLPLGAFVLIRRRSR